MPHILEHYIQQLPYASNLVRRRTSSSAFAAAQAVLPQVIAALPSNLACLAPEAWRIQRATWSEAGVLVAFIGAFHKPPVTVLRVPYTSTGYTSLQRHHTMLTAIDALVNLADWRSVVPRICCSGDVAGKWYMLEQALPGHALDAQRPAMATSGQLQYIAAATIGELHRCTTRPRVVDGQLLDRWVDRPLKQLQHISHPLLHSQWYTSSLNRLAAELHKALAGRILNVSWIHGDFWLGNLLGDVRTAQLSGIVDWDMAAIDDLPLHDLLHLVLYTRRLTERRELGDIIRSVLTDNSWTEDERKLIAPATLPPEAGGMRTMILLYWLRHVAGHLSQSSDHAHNWLWVRKNVVGVLRCI